ncbi:MAG: putative peroxiredoxin YgaF [Methyloligella sp.]|nr:MAG: putative peroxiredoxin YgaF [Methyloligella sp.]
MLDIGSKAPNFTLKNANNETIKLEEFKGKNVIVYFYPKDLTPGCTKQAIAFTEHEDEFSKRDTVIIGISPDSTASHEKFIKKHNLNLILLADEEKQAIESYGVWKEKKMYGRTFMGVERSTFLVDRTGTVQAIWRKVKVAKHINEVLEELDK